MRTIINNKLLLILSILICIYSNANALTAKEYTLSEKTVFGNNKPPGNQTPKKRHKKNKKTPNITKALDPLRIELNVADDDIPYVVLPVGRLGLLVIMKENDLFSSTPIRYIRFYDENLKQRWALALEVEYRYSFINYKIGSDSIYFVLNDAKSSRSRRDTNNFLNLNISLFNGGYNKTYYNLEELNEYNIHNLQITQNNEWVALLEHKKKKYYFSHYNSRIDSLSVEPIDLALNDLEWCAINYDTISKKVYTIFRDSKLKKSSIWLYINDAHTAKTLSSVEIKPSDDKLRLIDAKTVVMPNNQILLLGLLNLEREKQDRSVYDRGSQNMGVFSALCDNNTQKNFFYKPYLAFSNLDTLISPNIKYELQRAEERAKGRTLLPSFLSQIRVGQGRAKDSTPYVYLISEVYERKENTKTEISYDFYGRMVPYTKTFFEGFKYENVFYTEFSELGMPFYTTVLDISNDDLYPFLSDYTSTYKGKDNMLLYAYNKEKELCFRTINRRGAFSKIQKCGVNNLSKHDEVEKTWGNGIIYWYDNVFIVYGHQSLRNRHNRGSQKRHVFYINKFLVE